jgi:hypothetical protein
MSGATLDIMRELARLRTELDRLKTIERPIACRWRGNSAGAPATPADGDVYFDTGTAQVYIYANAGWVQIS